MRPLTGCLLFAAGTFVAAMLILIVPGVALALGILAAGLLMIREETL